MGRKSRRKAGRMTLNPDAKTQLARVRAHAEANRFPLEAVLRASETGYPMIGVGRFGLPDPHFTCQFRLGDEVLSITFTVEQHPAGWLRRIGMLGGQRPDYPVWDAFLVIGRELGMWGDVRNWEGLEAHYESHNSGMALSVSAPFEPEGQGG